MPLSSVDSGRIPFVGRTWSSTFVPLTQGTSNIPDANINSNVWITFSPLNSDAALLMRTKTCYITNINVVAQTFDFVVSATGAGAPAGTEQFMYVAATVTSA